MFSSQSPIVQEIVFAATTENKSNTLKTRNDELSKAAPFAPPGTTPAATGSASDVIPGVLDLITGAAGDNTTSGPPDLFGLLSTPNLALAAHPPTYAFMLFLLDPNGIQVTTEISLSTIEITSQVSQLPCFEPSWGLSNFVMTLHMVG